MSDSSEWLTSQQVADVLGMRASDLKFLTRDVLASLRPRQGEDERVCLAYPPEAVEAIRECIEKANIEENPILKSLVLNNPELHEVYESVGYSPSLRHQMIDLASEIRACCDPESLEASKSLSSASPEVLLAPAGAVALRSALSYCPLDRVTDSAIVVQYLWDAAVEARTGLLAELQDKWGSFRKPEGNRISAGPLWSLIHDGVNAVNCDKLPYEMLARKQDFDCLLFDVVVKIPRQDECDRRAALSFAARTYLGASWMHNHSLTERMAIDIFRLVRSDANKMKIPSLWPSVIAVAAVAGSLYFRFLELAFLLFVLALIFVLPLVHRGWTLSRLGSELDRVANELGEDWFSGPVLARRVERLYEFGALVPSVLPALLDLLP